MPVSDVFAMIRWWGALAVLGVLAFPLGYTLLGRLPGRGYAFSKMLGLLITSYLLWILGSLGILQNNLGGIVVSLILLGVLSYQVYKRLSDKNIRGWIRENRAHIITAEVVFAVIFIVWTWVRAQNPAITGTEKPMEFAFLNAVGRSESFPPLDPWLSGFAISYYYFGYVMTSLLAQLAGVTESVAFNLGLAWLAGGAGLGAYGLVYNLVAAGRVQEMRRMAIGLGLMASLALPLAGNMQILLELAHANGIGSDGFWAWLDVRNINEPATEDGFGETGPRFWWWWRSSRVIHEYHLSGREEAGLEPIAEFPGFSFILGDMHPHVLALPFAFLSVGVGLAWWLKPGREDDALTYDWDDAGWPDRIKAMINDVGWPMYVLTAIVLGGLSFLNTWDVLIHLFVIVGAFILRQWRTSGKWHNRLFVQTVVWGLLLVIPAILLYLPFYIGFRSQAGAPYLLPTFMRPTRLSHFLIIFGMPLLAIVSFIITLIAQRRTRYWGQVAFVALGLVGGLFILMLLLGFSIAASPDGSGRVIGLATELGLTLPPLLPEMSTISRLEWAFSAIGAIIPRVVVARVTWPWLTLFLSIMAGLLVMLWHNVLHRPAVKEPSDKAPKPTQVSAMPFVLLLIFTGVLLTLGPEFVYLRDNFGQRLNTIFKFYYQTWVLFGVSALFAIGYLWRTAPVVGRIVATIYGLLFIGVLAFPYYGAQARIAEYGEPSTLSGDAYMQYRLPDEYQAITWLRENVEGTPVIVEAVGGQYTTFARVSAHTGLPTLLGWAGHETQWRGFIPEPGIRDGVVQQIYEDPNWELTALALDEYDVSYIYIGPLETTTFGVEVVDKFQERLEVAYANNSVIIYRWLPE